MEVDWIYLAEVSVLWRAFLNRVITNFGFLTCRNFLGCLSDCQLKGRTFSVLRFACRHLQCVSCSKMYGTCACTLQVTQPRYDSAVKKACITSFLCYITRFYHARYRPIIQKGWVVFIYISRTYYVSNILISQTSSIYQR
jgi:hypothetical protein